MLSSISSALESKVALPFISKPVTTDFMVLLGLVSVAGINGFRHANLAKASGNYGPYRFSFLSLISALGFMSTKPENSQYKLAFLAITAVSIGLSYLAEKTAPAAPVKAKPVALNYSTFDSNLVSIGPNYSNNYRLKQYPNKEKSYHDGLVYIDARGQVEWSQPEPKAKQAEVHQTPVFIVPEPKKATVVEGKPSVAPATVVQLQAEENNPEVKVRRVAMGVAESVKQLTGNL